MSTAFEVLCIRVVCAIEISFAQPAGQRGAVAFALYVPRAHVENIVRESIVRGIAGLRRQGGNAHGCKRNSDISRLLVLFSTHFASLCGAYSGSSGRQSAEHMNY